VRYTLRNVFVSAVMPIHNGEKYLEASIAQLTRILGLDDQIVVVNDASTDKTHSLLRKWAMLDDRVLVVNNPNPGLTNALNLGIKEARHNWIARFDVDDKYAINRINAQSERISPGVGLIFSDYDNQSQGGKNLGTIPSALFEGPTALSLISSQRTAHPSALIRKDAFLNAGGYKTEDFPAEDISLWLRMIKNSGAISVPRTLLHYQIVPGSVSNTHYLNAKAKTTHLLRMYKIDYRHHVDVIENFKNYAALYQREPFGTERTILMFRDVIKYCSFYKLSVDKRLLTQLFSSLLVMIGEENFLKSTLRLRLESKKRQKERIYSQSFSI
jgi:glycosyltransferase involved in cell wall biosynthesis